MRNVRVAAGLLVLAAAMGCDKLPFGNTAKPAATEAPAAAPKPQLTDPGVLALVNGTPITIELYRRRVQALPEDDPRGFATALGGAKIIHRKPRTAEEREVLLDALIKEELAVQEAVGLGLERDPEVKRNIDDARRLILLNKLNARVLGDLKVDQAEVDDFYKKNPVVFKIPERIKVRQIVVADMKQAEALRATAVGGGDFAGLAREHSIGAGKEDGGSIGWKVRELDRQMAQLSGADLEGATTFFPQLEPVAFALEVGQVSQPVKGPDGNYYIIQIDERKAERQKPLTEISDQLKQGLLFQKQQQKSQEYFDGLWDKNKTSVQRNTHRLEQEP